MVVNWNNCVANMLNPIFFIIKRCPFIIYKNIYIIISYIYLYTNSLINKYILLFSFVIVLITFSEYGTFCILPC